MRRRNWMAAASVVVIAWTASAVGGDQADPQTITPLCRPVVTGPIIVATHDQIVAAGQRAEPPLLNTMGFGFAWPDTQMGVIRTDTGYEFFASDGAFHPRQLWHGHWVGNDNYGSVVTTVGTLDNPLGAGDPQDVSISPNPDPGVNPNYPSYTYIGGGPVFQVPITSDFEIAFSSREQLMLGTHCTTLWYIVLAEARPRLTFLKFSSCCKAISSVSQVSTAKRNGHRDAGGCVIHAAISFRIIGI